MTPTDRAYGDFFPSGFGAVTTRKRRGPAPGNITTTASPMVQSPCSSTMPSRAPSPSSTPTPALYHSSDTDWDTPSPLTSPTSTSFAHTQPQLPLSPSKSTKRNRRTSLASLSSRILAKVRSPSVISSSTGEKSESRKSESGRSGFWTPSRSNSVTRYANQNASEVWTSSQGLGAPHAGIANLYNNYHDPFEQPLDPFASAPDSKSIFIELTPTESYISTASNLPYSSSPYPSTPTSSMHDYFSYPWSLSPPSSPAASPGAPHGHKPCAAPDASFLSLSRSRTPTNSTATDSPKPASSGRDRGHQRQDSLLSLSSLSFLSLTPKKKRAFSQMGAPPAAPAITSKSTPSTPVQPRKSLQITRAQSFQHPSSSSDPRLATHAPQPLNVNKPLPPILVPNRGPPLPPSEDQSQHGHGRSQSYALFNSKRQGQSSSASPHLRSNGQISTRSQPSPGQPSSPWRGLMLGQSHLPTTARVRKKTKMSSWFIEEEDGRYGSSSASPNPSLTSSPNSSPSPSPLPATPSPASPPTLTPFLKKTVKSPLSIASSSPMSLSSPKLPLSPGVQSRRKHLMEQGQKEQEKEDEKEDEKEGEDKNGMVRAVPRGPRQPLKKRYGIVQFENDTGNYGDESACGSWSGSSASPCVSHESGSMEGTCTDESSIEERHEDLVRMWGSLRRKLFIDN